MYKVFYRAVIFYVIGIIVFLTTPFLIPISSYNPNNNVTQYNESRFAFIKNLKVHYREFFPMGTIQGKIVLLHGFYGSTFSWQKNIFELVEKGYYVVALDLPGYGFSDKSRNLDQSLNGKIDMFSKFILYIDKQYPQLNGFRWSSVGHSMGGQIVLKTSILYPDLFKNIVLVSPAINISSNNTIIYEPMKRWLSIALENGLINKDFIRGFLFSAYGREPTTEEIEGYLRPLQENGTALSIADNISSSQSSPANKIDLSLVKTSTLIVHGENDTWVPLSNSQDIQSKISTSDLKIIYGAGHCPQETHPIEFHNLLLDFM